MRPQVNLYIMSNHLRTSPDSAEDAGLSPTPTTGLSEEASETRGLFAGVTDPNAAAMNENGEAALDRQESGDVPGSESATNPGGLPSTESAEFQDGT